MLILVAAENEREGLAKDVLIAMVQDAIGRGKRRLQETKKKEEMEGAITVMDLDGMKVTPRDQQVLDLLVQGCSNKEIAGQLRISPRTVKQHLRTLFLRAGIRDGRKRVRLATAAFERVGVRS